MNLSSYLPLIITYIIAVIAIMRDYDKSSKWKKIIDWIGIMAFTTLTIISVNNQYAVSKDAISQKNEIDGLIKTQIDLKHNTDSLKQIISEQELNEILNQKDRMNSTGESNDNGNLAERFCYLTTIPDGKGRIMFAIHNPLSITIPKTYFSISGYGFLKQMRSKLVDGQTVYSKKDYLHSIIYYKDSIDIKPGVHIISGYHLKLGDSTDLPKGEIAAFEVYFIGPRYSYVEQLGTQLSDDHFSSLNAYRLYKLVLNNDYLRTTFIDENIPKSLIGFSQQFTLPPGRLYSKDF